MADFDITEWSDFVRGLVDPETAERMRAHLDSAPAATRRRVDALRRIAALGRADEENAAPNYAVRIAKALASVQRPASSAADSPKPAAAPQSPVASLRRLRLTITFDSQLEPAPAGRRNLVSSHRQIVLETEGYRVDLQLEHEVEPQGTVAVGQVMNTREAATSFPRVPVLVFSGQHEIDRTITSRFGEFQFEGLPRKDLELCLIVGEDFLEIPLCSGTGLGEEAGS